MSGDLLKRRIELMYPQARFIAVAPVAAGKIAGEEAEKSFQYVSIYNHRISSAMKPIGSEMLLISNSFLPSHAYNIALCWSLLKGNPAARSKSIAHNFKKFFAETALYERNCMFGRAFLVETLAFEQGIMAPLFQQVRNDPSMRSVANGFGAIMNAIVSQHELSH